VPADSHRGELESIAEQAAPPQGPGRRLDLPPIRERAVQEEPEILGPDLRVARQSSPEKGLATSAQ
jgi:hypothetical protein